jgi:hypothetical protein
MLDLLLTWCYRKGWLTQRVGGGDGHVPCHASLAIWVGHEARVHATCHGLARLREGGLCGSVVLLHELELDYVAHGGGDGLGSVSENGSHACGDGGQSTNDNLRPSVNEQLLVVRRDYSMCGWSTCCSRCETHDLHLGRREAGDHGECVDVLHYEYVFVVS